MFLLLPPQRNAYTEFDALSRAHPKWLLKGEWDQPIWDFTIAGEMWCYVEGELNRTVYKPGARAFLGTKSAKGYRVDDHLWVLEYARGPVYTMLPFGLADTLFSTLDVRTFSRTLYHYGRLVTRDLLGQVP